MVFLIEAGNEASTTCNAFGPSIDRVSEALLLSTLNNVNVGLNYSTRHTSLAAANEAFSLGIGRAIAWIGNLIKKVIDFIFGKKRSSGSSAIKHTANRIDDLIKETAGNSQIVTNRLAKPQLINLLSLGALTNGKTKVSTNDLSTAMKDLTNTLTGLDISAFDLKDKTPKGLIDLNKYTNTEVSGDVILVTNQHVKTESGYYGFINTIDFELEPLSHDQFAKFAGDLKNLGSKLSRQISVYGKLLEDVKKNITPENLALVIKLTQHVALVTTYERRMNLVIETFFMQIDGGNNDRS